MSGAPARHAASPQAVFWEAFWAVFHGGLEDGGMAPFVQLIGAQDGKARLNPGTAFRVACELYGITLDQLLGRDQRAEIVEPRKLAVWALKNLGAGWSYSAIGRALGGRDHTTIRNLNIKALALVKTSPRFAGACKDIQAYFASHEEHDDGFTE